MIRRKFVIVDSKINDIVEDGGGYMFNLADPNVNIPRPRSKSNPFDVSDSDIERIANNLFSDDDSDPFGEYYEKI